MMKNKLQVGSAVVWKEYHRDYITGTIKSLCSHNDVAVAKVVFSDCPEVPYWVAVEELYSLGNQ